MDPTVAARLRDPVKRLLKAGVQMSGVDLQRWSCHVRLARSHRRFLKQGYVPLDGYDVLRHFGDQRLDPSYRYVVEGFILARIRCIQEILSQGDIDRSTFADIGDSSGIFLKALGKRGTSINVSPTVLENIAGLETLQAGLPRIPLPEGSFDYVLCFETVEHLQDPIGGLKELSRLAKKGVLVSIPFVRRTRIQPYWPDRSRPPTEQHVVECSDRDFRKLLTYTDLCVASRVVYRVFDVPRTLPEAIAAVVWTATDRDLFCGVFKKFSIYFLRHRSESI